MRNRKIGLFFGLAAIAMLLPAAQQVSAVEITPAAPVTRASATPDVKWVGMAVSRVGGRIFQSEPKGYENEARATAIAECENASGVSCANAISVPSAWDMTVVRCGSRYFIAGSGQGTADQNALDKAAAAGVNPGSCSKVAAY